MAVLVFFQELYWQLRPVFFAAGAVEQVLDLYVAGVGPDCRMLGLRRRWRCSLSSSGRGECNHRQDGCHKPPIRFRSKKHERTRMLDAQFLAQGGAKAAGQSCI